MRDWIRIFVLVAFIRLQFVCCCGSFAHFEHSDHDHATISRHACECSSAHSSSQDDASTGRSCESIAESGCESTCALTAEISHRSQSVDRLERIAPLCPCSHQSDGNSHRHSLYMMEHGSIVPLTPADDRTDVLVKSSLLRNFGADWQVPMTPVSDPPFSAHAKASILLMLGHRLI